jgi:hypothetical protein
MADWLTDAQIVGLLAEPKPLPPDYRRRIVTKRKGGHGERELDIRGVEGSDFCLIVRQSAVNPLDFSVILGYRMPQSTGVFRLRRYNGNHGEHTNRLEGATFTGCHIHTATQRYQDLGAKEDHFAEPTVRYSDLDGAVGCMVADCGFIIPSQGQPGLFPHEEV